MAENHFTRGANKIISLDFTDNPHGIGINDVTALEFTVRQGPTKHTYGLSDFERVGDKLQYKFSQEQTLALRAGQKVKLEIHILANGNRYPVTSCPAFVQVFDTEYNEVLT